MAAISADDDHSMVNPHETMQLIFALALEYYFPIVAFTRPSHFSGSAYTRVSPSASPYFTLLLESITAAQ